MKNKRWKRMLAAFVMAAVMICGMGSTVKAEDPEEEAKQSYELPIQSNETKDWPEGPKVYGKSAVLIDAETGAVLYEKNMDEKHYPASITKILTALVAVENADLETDHVLITQESVDFLEPGDAYIGMRPGEEITLKDALYAILLASANEVSYAIAENVGNKLEGTGSGYEKFIQKMNERAKELGAKNTHFINPHGLFSEEHYTSCYDMAVISAQLFQHPEVLQIMQTGEYRIPPTNLETEERIFQQKHQMLVKNSKYYFDYCVGGKTGYTDEAGNTLVTLADNGKLKLVCVEMDTRGQHIYDDTRSILEYGFQNFSKKELSSSVLENAQEKDGIQFHQNKEVYAVLPNNAQEEQVSFAVEEQKKNTITITYNNRKVGTVPGEKSGGKQKESEKEGRSVLHLPDFPKLFGLKMDVRILIAAGILVLIIIFTLIMVFRRKRRKRSSFLTKKRGRFGRSRRNGQKIKWSIKKNRRHSRKRW